MKVIVRSDGRFQRNLPAVKKGVPTPYRAVILGEDCIVKGWHGENLLTDKGEFVVQRLNNEQVDSESRAARPRSLSRNFPIETVRILEMATIERGESGTWLLNGHPISSLQQLQSGIRLGGIFTSEVLRVYKEEIAGIAWIEVVSAGSVSAELDTVLSDWRAARDQEIRAKTPYSAQPHFLNLFAGWSRPVWLTKFERVGGTRIKAIRASSGAPRGRFSNNYALATITGRGGERSITVEPELRKAIQLIVSAGGRLSRQDLISRLKPNSENYQPEKLLRSRTAKALVKAGLLGKTMNGRTVVYSVEET
jgi:hypothetical protein